MSTLKGEGIKGVGEKKKMINIILDPEIAWLRELTLSVSIY